MRGTLLLALIAVARDAVLTHRSAGEELAPIHLQADAVFDIEKKSALFVVVISGDPNGSEHVFALHARHDGP